MKRNIVIIAITLTFAISLILAILEIARETRPVVQEPIIIETVMPTPTPTPTKRYAGTFKTYGYDICLKCCGKLTAITASGEVAQVGVTVAADWNVLPKGTVIEIEGIGIRIVQDRGGAIKGHVIDILVSNHAEAYKATNTRKVWIIEGWEEFEQ